MVKIGMEKKSELRIAEYFKGVELKTIYEPYFCRVEDAIAIVGKFCGFRNLKQIPEWASHEKIKEILAKEFGVSHVPCYTPSRQDFPRLRVSARPVSVALLVVC